MAVGSANNRVLRPNDNVNDGDSVTEHLWVDQLPQFGPSRPLIPLTIRGQAVNVSEEIRTVIYQTSTSPVYHVLRTYRVSSLNHAPLQGVTQLDVICAIRDYDSQQGTQRHQVVQTPTGPARGPHYPPPSPPPAAGAAALLVAPAAGQDLDELQKVVEQVDLEYQQTINALLQRDPDRLARMERMEKDHAYKAQLVSTGTMPSDNLLQRLMPFLPLFMAYKSFKDAWGRANTQQPATARKQALLQLLGYEAKALADLGIKNNSQALKNAAFELQKLRERCAKVAC
ncbi:MAG: hypothetical protein ACRC9T_02660 [Vibrionaceae bacterium]